jgi:hypothetical protein
VNSPTGISRFLGLGEPYVPTDLAIGQLCTRGVLYIKEHVKLHILLGGGTFPWSSWIVGAGLCEISHRNLEIFGFGGSIWTHGSR